MLQYGKGRRGNILCGENGNMQIQIINMQIFRNKDNELHHHSIPSKVLYSLFSVYRGNEWCLLRKQQEYGKVLKIIKFHPLEMVPNHFYHLETVLNITMYFLPIFFWRLIYFKLNWNYTLHISLS